MESPGQWSGNWRSTLSRGSKALSMIKLGIYLELTFKIARKSNMIDAATLL